MAEVTGTWTGTCSRGPRRRAAPRQGAGTTGSSTATGRTWMPGLHVRGFAQDRRDPLVTLVVAPELQADQAEGDRVDVGGVQILDD
eukprot:CAMPEP_0179262406 /NCGR_PEP_ID=MMETSP0797-20121207/27350_1 /TAXON_ID=47934 /ORGANISM="Dinophysis acuminata, Strain DAEP01" /LENGTH=85 /DNA_ID=CAMNT_0020970539 /DNA_START=301 /DNA_END=559 /DNA_ORIENTATION=+